MKKRMRKLNTSLDAHLPWY